MSNAEVAARPMYRKPITWAIHSRECLATIKPAMSPMEKRQRSRPPYVQLSPHVDWCNMRPAAMTTNARNTPAAMRDVRKIIIVFRS